MFSGHEKDHLTSQKCVSGVGLGIGSLNGLSKLFRFGRCFMHDPIACVSMWQFFYLPAKKRFSGDDCNKLIRSDIISHLSQSQ